MARLTIKNKTAWNTADIRRMVRAAEKYFDLKGRRTVEVTYNHGSGRHQMHGRARIGVHMPAFGSNPPYVAEGTWLKLWLPYGFAGAIPNGPIDRASVRDIAWLIFHEVAHNQGMEHKHMGRKTPLFVVWDQPDLPPAMGKGDWQLRYEPKVVTPPPPKPKKDLVAIRHARTQKLVKKWGKMLVRAQYNLDKYSRTLRYYERKLAERMAPKLATEPVLSPPVAPPLAAKEQP